MIATLAIRRFRGIGSLDLTNLGSVNVFVGANAAGKTTLLEAASVAASPLNPRWLMTLSQWREMSTASQQAGDWLRSYFYGLASEQGAELNWTDTQAGDARLTIRPLVGGRLEAGDFGSSVGSMSSAAQPEDYFGGVEYHYSAANRVVADTRLVFMPNPGNPDAFRMEGLTPDGVRGLGAFFIHARRSASLGDTASMLTAAAESRTEEAIYAALRRVDPRVKRLIPGLRDRTPTVLADVGLPRLVPVNLLGDGFARVLLMITGAAKRNDNLLLVDDIDSGLHSTVMTSLWRSLIDLHAARPFQLFCTTHNDEMLQSTLDAFKEVPHLLRVFRVDRHRDDRVTVQPYDFELLRDVSAAGMDIR